MIDTVTIWLDNATKTMFCAASLARSLYVSPLTVYLFGGLGAGKTTFVQGLARGLDVKDVVNSPTFALERRYGIKNKESGIVGNLLHIDLYRIEPKEAEELIRSSDDFEGIRCIEWSEKIPEQEKQQPHIDIILGEKSENCRRLTMCFHDIPLPSREEVESWREEVQLPAHIQKHCDTVGGFAGECAKNLLGRGVVVRPLAVKRAGEIHDLFRFIDFHNGACPGYIPESTVWKTWKQKYSGLKHEPACVMFLRERGFGALASIVEPHGLTLPSPERTMTEQKILFYADKRCLVDRVVGLEERFADFKKRYADAAYAKHHEIWYEEARRVERELFPGGIPSGVHPSS